jgi:hypothetical protein
MSETSPAGGWPPYAVWLDATRRVVRLTKARRRIREAMKLFVDGARKATILDDVKLATGAARAVRAYATLRKKAEVEDRRAALAARRAVRVLRTGRLKMSARDAARLLGLSHQRVHQLTQNDADFYFSLFEMRSVDGSQSETRERPQMLSTHNGVSAFGSPRRGGEVDFGASAKSCTSRGHCQLESTAGTVTACLTTRFTILLSVPARHHQPMPSGSTIGLASVSARSRTSGTPWRRSHVRNRPALVSDL